MGGLPRGLAVAVLLAVMAGCGSDDRDPGAPDAAVRGVAVNGYLWRAALDTLSFLPIVEVDPRAGALISDWYIDPDDPTGRIKVSVFILGTELRADALQVAVVRQARNASGIWVNQPVQASTKLQIEDAILARARQLRIDRIED